MQDNNLRNETPNDLLMNTSSDPDTSVLETHIILIVGKHVGPQGPHFWSSEVWIAATSYRMSHGQKGT